MVEKVTFVSTKYKGLELVHTPMGLKDTHGNKVPSVRCNFVATAYGYAYSTSDPKMVEWLKAHDHYKRGLIQEHDPSIARQVEKPEVTRGGVSTASGKQQDSTPAPKEHTTEPRRAKVVK